MKFAAIDIGSNAVRLLLSRVLHDKKKPIIRKEALVRIPIRLGEDVFSGNIISHEKSDQLIKAIDGFKNLIAAYGAIGYRACATSAMREAGNASIILSDIKKKTGVHVEVIDGAKEAQIICSIGIEKNIKPDRSYLYIDVGGGSTDITLISDGRQIDTRSFNIGTIRLLKGQVGKSQWKELKNWLKDKTTCYRPLTAIGSGGNINKIFKLCRKKEGKPFSHKRLKTFYSFIRGFSLKERINNLNLRPDRADVIVPATMIYISLMKWAGITKMYVPQIGLVDGLIMMLYKKHLEFQSDKKNPHGRLKIVTSDPLNHA